MDYEIKCPFCEKCFDAILWESGECPACEESYWWAQDCSEDDSDSWVYVEWENIDK